MKIHKAMRWIVPRNEAGYWIGAAFLGLAWFGKNMFGWGLSAIFAACGIGMMHLSPVEDTGSVEQDR